MLDLLLHFAQRGGASSLSTHLLIGKLKCMCYLVIGDICDMSVLFHFAVSEYL